MAEFVSGEQIARMLQSLISAKKQVHEWWVDLTVARIYRVKGMASLDFGGGEFQPGKTELCLPIKRSPEDAYGWWELHEGYYLVEFNENLPSRSNQVALLQPHARLLAGGCFHPTLLVQELNSELRVPLWVPKIGIQLKENARISRLWVMRF